MPLVWGLSGAPRRQSWPFTSPHARQPRVAGRALLRTRQPESKRVGALSSKVVPLLTNAFYVLFIHCSQKWCPPVSFSRMLGFQACAIMPGLDIWTHRDRMHRFKPEGVSVLRRASGQELSSLTKKLFPTDTCLQRKNSFPSMESPWVSQPCLRVGPCPAADGQWMQNQFNVLL